MLSRKFYTFLPIFLFLLFSCETFTNAHTYNADYNENKVYKLHLTPSNGSHYAYDLSSETNIRLEVNDQEIINSNKSDIGLSYDVSSDTSGNFLFTTHYDKIHLYTKSGETETDFDAAAGPGSFNPVERMLAILKDASIIATVSASGEVKKISGYQQAAEKILAGFDAADMQSRNTVRSQWDKLIGEGMIKKNIEELFRIFPDSVVHIGQRWKLDSRQSGELPLRVKSFYHLDGVDEGVATIRVEAELEGDSTASSMMGQQVRALLKGSQEGEYKVEIKTGMLLSSKATYKVEGTIEMMGREVPIAIDSETRVGRRKNN